MPMVALLSDAAFDSETTELLGAAFEAAWEKVNAAGSALAEGPEAASTRELLAKRIIELAKRGERNLDRLVESALVIWQNRKRPRIAPSRRDPLCSAGRRPAVDRSQRAARRLSREPGETGTPNLAQDP
jgi:hypothetical protein